MLRNHLNLNKTTNLRGILVDIVAQDVPLGSMDVPWSLRGAMIHNVVVPCKKILGHILRNANDIK